MKWSVEKKCLYIGGKTVATAGPVEKAVEFNNVVVVLIEKDASGLAQDRNVFGFDLQTARQRWQVSRQDWTEGRSNPATALWLEDGKVWLHFWAGLDGYIDITNGNVTIPPGQRRW